MKNRFSIKKKISIIVFFSIILVFFPLLLLVLKNSNAIVYISENENFNRLTQIVKWEIEDEIEYAAINLRRIVADSQVKEFLIQRDRAGLYEYLNPEYALIRDRIIRFHFHLPDGTSFLRVHNPDLYDDNLIEIRPMLVQMIESHSQIQGLEKGREGFNMRVMMPIFDHGEYIGSVEYGLDFSNAFLCRIKDRYEGSYYFYELNEDGSFTFIASSGKKPQCTVTYKDVEMISTGELKLLKRCNGLQNFGMFPIMDFSGTMAGFIATEFPRDMIVKEISKMVSRFTITSLSIAILITMVVLLSLDHIFFRPLHSVVEQTMRINVEMNTGDLQICGNIDENAVDFRDIIEAINNIIGTLRDRGAILKAIIDGFPGIVYYLDNEYKVLWANERAKEIAGEEIVGNILTPNSSRHCIFEEESDLLFVTMNEGTMNSKNAVYCGHDGIHTREEYWDHIAIPIFDEEQQVRNILRISTDITDKEEAKAKLKKLNKTLERRVAEEVRKRKEQEDKAYNQSRLASIGELAAGMAHELNQPLNTIAFSVENLYTRFLEQTIDEQYFKKKIKAISGDISRTRRIIEHVRIFARESSEEYRINFSVNQCILNALSMVGVQFATHGIDIEKDLQDSMPEICGNPFQYEQIILNLLSNAKDAIEERSQQDSQLNIEDPLPQRIKIGTRTINNEIWLEISDNGTGIPGTIADRVFDPFFTTKDPGTGTGLGLSISYGIVKELRGSIDIIPRKKGTTMRVIIPTEENLCKN